MIKKEKKNKKALFAIGALLVVALVGGTIAMNRTIFPFNNEFDLAVFKTEVSEEFASPTNWQPCDETAKVVTVKNESNVDAVARIRVDESWIAQDGSELDLIKDNVKLADFTLSNSDWELRDGYYYLKTKLQPGDTSEFMNKVTFNCAADFGENTMIDGYGNVTQTTDDYNGASYHLVVTAQLMMDDPNMAWEDAFDEYKQPETFALMKPGMANTIHGVYEPNVPRAFKRSRVLPDAASVTNRTEVQMDGETPIYFWYSDTDRTIYWYSTADAITLNASDYVGGMFSGSWFNNNNKLEDISGFTYFDMHNINGLGGLFYGDNLPDDMTPLAHWDVSGVQYFGGLANSTNGSTGEYYFKQEHMEALKYWKLSDTLNVSLSGAFSSNPNITDISALSNWDVSHVTSLSGAFYNMPNLTSLRGLERWNVSNVTDMSSAFYGTRISSVAPIAGWNVSNCDSFYAMFTNVSSLTDATALNEWNVKSDADLKYMFKNTGISSESGYPTWYTSGRRE